MDRRECTAASAQFENGLQTLNCTRMEGRRWTAKMDSGPKKWTEDRRMCERETGRRYTTACSAVHVFNHGLLFAISSKTSMWHDSLRLQCLLACENDLRLLGVDANVSSLGNF